MILKRIHRGAIGVGTATVLVFLAAFVAMNLGTQFDETPDEGASPLATRDSCPTKCAFFMLQTCAQGEENRIIGMCFAPAACSMNEPAPCNPPP